MTFLSMCTSLFCFTEEISLKTLIKYDKATCLERLEKATNEELWDAFLEGQAELFFEPELHWIAKQHWLDCVNQILEIGSGNGAYLSKFASLFPEKTYHGIEKLSLSVKQAKERYAKDGIDFDVGDAEIFNEQLINSADALLFRLTLQHLKKPLVALQNAWHYLSFQGYIVIIDSCDSARKTSHPIFTIDQALELVAESQLKSGIGNRKITLEILQSLENQGSELNHLYELVTSNIDASGRLLQETFRLEGEESRKKYVNHNLLFSTLLHRTYQIPVEIEKAYDELIEYLGDENAWTVLGMHYLVLKKK